MGQKVRPKKNGKRKETLRPDETFNGRLASQTAVVIFLRAPRVALLRAELAIKLHFDTDNAARIFFSQRCQITISKSLF